MLITNDYKKLQEDFHIQRPDYGCGSGRHADFVLSTANKLGTRDILDYGCGKGYLQKSLPFPIQNYDPAVPEFSRLPWPADFVVCTDVLEHIEPDCLDAVLDDLKNLTKQVIFMNVATRPAAKVLQDGRNAHLIQKPPNWWLAQFLSRFDIVSFQRGEGEFACIAAQIGVQLTQKQPEMTSYMPEPA